MSPPYVPPLRGLLQGGLTPRKLQQRWPGSCCPSSRLSQRSGGGQVSPCSASGRRVVSRPTSRAATPAGRTSPQFTVVSQCPSPEPDETGVTTEEIRTPRPASSLDYNQRLAELSYEQYFLHAGDIDEPVISKTPRLLIRPDNSGKQMTCALATTLARLPPSMRITIAEVLAKSRRDKVGPPEAAARLLVGKEVTHNLLSTKISDRLRTSPTIDLKVWLAAARSAAAATTFRPGHQGDTPVSEMVTLDRVLAAMALLWGADHVTAISATGLLGQEAPEVLRLFPKLQTLDASGCKALRSITALEECQSLRAVDLSDCPNLTDVSSLGRLPLLQAIDLSRCTSLEDLTSMLSCPVAVTEHEDPLGQGAHLRATGHPALRYLGLTGCSRLKSGISHIPHCEALSTVDLFDCTAVQACECFLAAAAPQMETLVWPSLECIEQLAKQQGWSEERMAGVVGAAVEAVVWKRTAARRGDRKAPLLPLTGHAHQMAKMAASKAASGLVNPTSLDQTLLNTVATVRMSMLAEGANLDDSELATSLHTISVAPEKAEMESRALLISPLAFLRGLKSTKFQVSATPLTSLFQALDVSRRGGISAEDILNLERWPASQAVLDEAISALFSRHCGSSQAVSADLAVNRSVIDPLRITECLVVAGVEDVAAQEVAHALAYSAAGALHGDGKKSAELALGRCLQAYALARAVELTGDFKEVFLKEYPDPKEVFVQLDSNKSNQLSWEEFNERLPSLVSWEYAETQGSLEAVFRLLDLDGTGILTPKELQHLRDFNGARLLEAMETVGRSIRRFQAGACRPKPWDKFDLDPRSTVDKGKTISRRDFVSAWEATEDHCGKKFGVNPKLVFGLLDASSRGYLTREDLLILTYAIPKRAEVAAFAALRGHLKSHYGTLEAAHEFFLSADGALVDAAQAPVKQDRTKRRGK